ncbi:MAG: fructose-1,6-bisphosphatase, class II [Candidatus Xenolissoclinum pacificiensis L6]|uniref:Fructose-1,6-bisphosphatase n=1 Tax=Candidatus Xenolissoclinum pacificiensis L6 TaxID=1401685 RepID=W2UZE7_9RICK|nr:MAG: fructose-1,6-bisphosphatase, class II [Candidatus Xenolissoclinum pacificiensis L6]
MLENLIFKFLEATEASAISCYKKVGCGDPMLLDGMAVLAMRDVLNKITDCCIEVVIGEGERDAAPMLYVGERLGNFSSETQLDMAVDPLEGTSLTANGKPGALSVLAIGPKGGFITAPDIYMSKIVLLKKYSEGINIENSIYHNLKTLAKNKGCDVTSLTVIVLERDRHLKIINDIRSLGARVFTIDDGDIYAILAVLMFNTADIYVGIGGAPEGVLSAVCVNSLSGFMQARFKTYSDADKSKLLAKGIDDQLIFASTDLSISPENMFIATGVTTGPILEGVNAKGESHSLIISEKGYTFLNRIRFQEG